MRKELENRKEFSQKEIDIWFDCAKADEIKDGVIWINEPHHFEDVYAFLIQGSTSDLLVDTGMGIAPIRPLLDKIRDVSKPLVVANTHWHFDHIGGNKEFEKVYIPFRSQEVYGIKKGWTKKEISKYFFSDGFWHGTPSGFDKENFSVPDYQKTDFLPNNINLGDRTIQTIYTPGHTSGSVSFYDQTNGILFTGDLLYEGPLYAFEEESNPDHYLQSLINMSNLFIKRIHPGHDHSDTSSFPNLINEAILLFERAKNKEVWDALGEFENTVEYHHPDIKLGRRLKIVVSKNYVR